MGLPVRDAEAIISNADFKGNKNIDYGEFLAATINLQNELTHERLWMLFNTFDTDNSGTITEDNLY